MTMAPSALSSTRTTSSSSTGAVRALLGSGPSSTSSTRCRFVEGCPTTETSSLAGVPPLDVTRGSFLGRVGILISSVQVPLMCLLFCEGSLLWEG